jgi:murein DD-endopeptidase MepM/ murein hydrolase activator NlpD
MTAPKGDFIKKGQQIGAIGNLGGIYSAHLHPETRRKTHAPLGGHTSDTSDHPNPADFISKY